MRASKNHWSFKLPGYRCNPGPYGICWTIERIDLELLDRAPPRGLSANIASDIIEDDTRTRSRRRFEYMAEPKFHRHATIEQVHPGDSVEEYI